jgi:Na+/melibiose symporter-like transporter
VQTYGAIVDCLADALVVKNGRNDEEDSASGLQSLSWFFLGIGGALFTFVGSQMSTDTSNEDQVSLSGARNYNKVMVIFPISLFGFLFFVKESKTKFRPSLKALFQQLVRLFVALFSPPFLVIRTASWIILSKASQITLTSGTRVFITSELKIAPDWQGFIEIGSYLFLALGVILYYNFFRHTSFRKIFFFSQSVAAVVYMLDYILVKRWNKDIGLSDIPFLFASSAFTEVVDRLNSMPFLVMAGQLCPENMEATFFALLMSLSNQGVTIADMLGGVVLKAYDVKKGSYDGLPTAILIRSGCVLGALLFIFLLPNTSALNPTNVESLRPTNPYIIKILKFADMYHPEKFEEEQKEKGDDNKV